ncbi:MAG: MFS transporter [Candidatus Omnitrophica bacterium]|nr:MFS transporter [Candidatus Omnitrophota bacterium]
MLISSLTTAAWLVKPFIGYLVDNFLSKKIWIFLALVADIVIVAVVGLIGLPIALLITLLLFNSANAAFRDVSVDGVMCVEGKRLNLTGKIQSVQWISISASGLVTGIAGGFIAEKWGYQAGFLCLIPVYLIVGLTAYFFKEERSETGKNKNRIFVDLKQLLKDKRLLIVCAFIFLYKYSPSFGTPLFFIQRDVFKWDKIWIGTLATIATVFEITGALLYYRFSQRLQVKKWLFWSVIVGAVTTLSYLYYTPVTAVIYGIIYSFMGMFIFILVMDFMARNTVKGLEATSFALLCSVSNLALVASNLSGAFLLEHLALPWLIVLSSVTSFLCLPLIRKIE